MAGRLNCTLPVVYWNAAALKVIKALRLSGGMENFQSLMNTAALSQGVPCSLNALPTADSNMKFMDCLFKFCQLSK